MEGRVRELLRLKAVRKAVSTALESAVNTGETPRSGGVDTLQSLSALMDGEARDLELRRVLRHLESADEGADTLSADALRATWHRLHLARHALHGEETFANVSLLAAVRAAVDADPAPRRGAARGWLRAAGRCAVAASVAALVLVVRPGDDAPSIARVATLPVGVANTVGAVPVQASYGTRDVPTLRPADRDAYRELARQRLRRYSQEHAEHASLNTPQGMLPFARVPVIEAAQANELDEP